VVYTKDQCKVKHLLQVPWSPIPTFIFFT